MNRRGRLWGNQLNGVRWRSHDAFRFSAERLVQNSVSFDTCRVGKAEAGIEALSHYAKSNGRTDRPRNFRNSALRGQTS
jgi:hypothetical protein